MVHGLRGEASCHILMFHLLTRRPPAHVLRCTKLLSDEVHETSRVADRRARREAPQGRRGMTGADAHQFSWAAARGRKVDLTSDCCCSRVGRVRAKPEKTARAPFFQAYTLFSSPDQSCSRGGQASTHPQTVDGLRVFFSVFEIWPGCGCSLASGR